MRVLIAIVDGLPSLSLAIVIEFETERFQGARRAPASTSFAAMLVDFFGSLMVVLLSFGL